MKSHRIQIKTKNIIYRFFLSYCISPRAEFFFLFTKYHEFRITNIRSWQKFNLTKDKSRTDITKFHTTSSRLTVTQIKYSNIWKIFTWICTFGFTDICSDVIYPDFWRCILIFLENSRISLNRVNKFTWNYKIILRFSIFNIHSIFRTVFSLKEQCTFTDRIDSVAYYIVSALLEFYYVRLITSKDWVST